ncbi:hypothetical protein [Bradyrhizobium japonicum]|uniref:hypothetical protein n=1 Tax=Bradyrhizobium japonicum TaxID=375 RepID=UPI001BA4FADE|nr:hypothetical protein [Bradyrhizobium japonicum]MBR0913123.1 hypothetical protein [Bradyrhizobium japonicum]
MSVYFEEGALPNGEKTELCVVELSAGNVGKFPADALTQDGKTTYREQYAEAYDRYKNGDQDKTEPTQDNETAKPEKAPAA